MLVFVLAGVLFGGLCRFGGALGLVFGCGFLVVGLVVCCWGVFCVLVLLLLFAFG